ncbi:MAG: NERD domain-containing protein [Anaerolineae bacterium]|nr:NERD domain-containing protein [Anaerolineae bacterium]
MRIVTNEKLVSRNRKLAQYLFFISFGLLGVGLFVAGRQISPENELDIALGLILPPVILILAYGLTFFSVRTTNLWVRQPRPETAIAEGLKGLSTKSVLYNYYHFPARHVLVCPQGVFAIVTRYQDGRFVNQGDKWRKQSGIAGKITSLFRFDSIGSPSTDALRAAQHVQSLFKQSGKDVEVKPLIVFVDPRVSLTISDPVVPVCHSAIKHELSLKQYIYDLGKPQGMPLTPEELDLFEKQTVNT